MQVGKLALKQHMIMVGARNIAGAARAGATGLDRMLHGRDHLGMLAHAETVARTPDGDLLLTVFGVAGRLRELAGLTLEIGKNVITAFFVQAVQGIFEKRFEIHITPVQTS